MNWMTFDSKQFLISPCLILFDRTLLHSPRHMKSLDHCKSKKQFVLEVYCIRISFTDVLLMISLSLSLSLVLASQFVPPPLVHTALSIGKILAPSCHSRVLYFDMTLSSIGRCRWIISVHRYRRDSIIYTGSLIYSESRRIMKRAKSWEELMCQSYTVHARWVDDISTVNHLTCRLSIVCVSF